MQFVLTTDSNGIHFSAIETDPGVAECIIAGESCLESKMSWTTIESDPGAYQETSLRDKQPTVNMHRRLHELG